MVSGRQGSASVCAGRNIRNNLCSLMQSCTVLKRLLQGRVLCEAEFHYHEDEAHFMFYCLLCDDLKAILFCKMSFISD